MRQHCLSYLNFTVDDDGVALIVLDPTQGALNLYNCVECDVRGMP
jgi:hypothetical protein